MLPSRPARQLSRLHLHERPLADHAEERAEGHRPPAREGEAPGVHGLHDEPVAVRREREGVADLGEAAERPQAVALPRLARFPLRLDLDALEALDPAAGRSGALSRRPSVSSSTASPSSTAATQRSRYARSVYTSPTRTGCSSPQGSSRRLSCFRTVSRALSLSQRLSPMRRKMPALATGRPPEDSELHCASLPLPARCCSPDDRLFCGREKPDGSRMAAWPVEDAKSFALAVCGQPRAVRQPGRSRRRLARARGRRLDPARVRGSRTSLGVSRAGARRRPWRQTGASDRFACARPATLRSASTRRRRKARTSGYGESERPRRTDNKDPGWTRESAPGTRVPDRPSAPQRLIALAPVESELFVFALGDDSRVASLLLPAHRAGHKRRVRSSAQSDRAPR